MIKFLTHVMAGLQPIFGNSLKKLEKQLECPQCEKKFSDPKVLGCFHIFCKLCLVRLVVQDQHGQLSVRCPTCRQSTLLPTTSVSGLQSAFHINHLMDIQQILERLNKSGTSLCGKCKQQAEISHFCLKCSQLICSACLCVHERWEELQDHQVVSLEDIQEDFSCLISHKQVIKYCLHHPSMALTLCCETCNELICTKCTILEHKHHHYKKVNEAIDQCRRTISASQKSLEKKLISIRRDLKQLASQRLTIFNQRATVEENVVEQFSELHRALDEKKEEILYQVNRITQGRLETVLLQEKEMKVFKSQVKSCLEFVKNNLKVDTEIELMSTEENVVQETRKIVNHTIIGCAVNEEVHMEFNMTGVHDLTSQIRELKATIETLEQRLSPTDDSENEEEHTSGYETISSQIPHDYSEEISTEEDSRVEETLPANSCLNYPNQHLKPLTTRSMEKICFYVKQPRGITLNSEGELIVTSESENCIKVFSPNGDTLRTFTGIEPQIFNMPNGVTTDEDDNVLVVDTCNHRIHRYTSQWKPSGIVGEAGTDSLQFSNPYGVGYNPINGKIYICDNCNHRIQILHPKLSLYRTFGAKGNGVGCFKHPWGLAFDSTGNVYIADSNNHRIQVFNPDGEFVREFGSEGKERGRLKLPRGIAIDCEDLIYVSEVANNRISVFTVEGIFQQVIGYKGSGPNQLRQPHELVVDDNDGILYVCDYGNNRIQIFNTH